MDSELRLSPREVCTIAVSLAEVELFWARQLTWVLPTSTSFEEHCQIGLAIGAATRRMKILLQVGQELAIGELAPSPSEELQRFKLNLKSNSSKGTLYSHEFLYQTVLSQVKTLGLMSYDLQTTLQYCSKLGKEYKQKLNHPFSISPDTIIETLLRIGTTYRDRITRSPIRVRRGNTQKNYDKRWQLLPQGCPPPRMKRIETQAGLMHKLHHTALRETLAAEAVALNLFEYDGMPWEFYIDMGRQCEDEARHALLAEMRLREMGGKIGQFQFGCLGNLYHTFWEMTLEERLIALNLDTEAAGQGYLSNVAHRLEKIGDKESATHYEFVLFDERRHARFGIRWFKYLYPDTVSREKALETARAFTIINLASNCAEVIGDNVINVIDEWLAHGGVYHSDEPATADHEQEISLLTARRRTPSLNSKAQSGTRVSNAN